MNSIPFRFELHSPAILQKTAMGNAGIGIQARRFRNGTMMYLKNLLQ